LFNIGPTRNIISPYKDEQACDGEQSEALAITTAQFSNTSLWQKKEKCNQIVPSHMSKLCPIFCLKLAYLSYWHIHQEQKAVQNRSIFLNNPWAQGYVCLFLSATYFKCFWDIHQTTAVLLAM